MKQVKLFVVCYVITLEVLCVTGVTSSSPSRKDQMSSDEDDFLLNADVDYKPMATSYQPAPWSKDTKPGHSSVRSTIGNNEISIRKLLLRILCSEQQEGDHVYDDACYLLFGSPTAASPTAAAKQNPLPVVTSSDRLALRKRQFMRFGRRVTDSLTDEGERHQGGEKRYFRFGKRAATIADTGPIPSGVSKRYFRFGKRTAAAALTSELRREEDKNGGPITSDQVNKIARLYDYYFRLSRRDHGPPTKTSAAAVAATVKRYFRFGKRVIQRNGAETHVKRYFRFG